MCSLFMLSTRTMDNYQAGDLTDILRGGSANGNISSNLSDHHQESRHTADTWRYPSDHPMNFSSSSSSCAHMDAEEEGNKESFGDPFSSYLRDPLLHELDLSGSPFFSSSKSSEISMDGGGVGVATTATTFGGGGLLGHHQGGIAGGDPVNKRPCNIFSRMLQISPSAKVPVSSGDSPLMGTAVPCKTSASSAMVGGNMIINGNRSSGGKGGCLLENTGMQISSPRNPGIKRRKSQAKKVVCIPAPAAANSRPTGEVVPSDLWAWRKYGQKPIKGSPYPRGYYRCSSSKGCSARKQVERSRTDPNMLVITYTSEHNHPWPTQRNALAGSTRSQPSKNAGASKTSPNTSHHHQKPSSPTKEEQNNNNDIIPNMSSDNHTSQVSPVISAGGTSTVKEEFEQVIEKQLELHHHHHQHQFNGHDDHRGGFAYRPSMPDDNQSNHHHEDFFADLGEIEADPLNLLFSQCFTADEQQKAGSKDPFNIFDWSSGDTEATATAPTATATTTTNNSNTATPFGEANKRML